MSCETDTAEPHERGIVPVHTGGHVAQDTGRELTPKGAEDVVQWAKVKEGFGKMDEFGASGEGNAYIMGDAPCYADTWIAGYIVWIKLILPAKWEVMKSWHGGRWATLLWNLEKYETVV
ncbi:hypothetical protein B0H17DRAFT_1131071 [Mycena rosella]|uniref:Glutathione S-transferase UstS-like C-terminal domain-containing protein n=1 Tax=Mycena rosella TaxID=1033263 RepID=A0AAD7GIA9_MYCRO|nr:hypothetical protein B0H17DRAFT_1131071 [Mycena rosella]